MAHDDGGRQADDQVKRPEGESGFGSSSAEGAPGWPPQPQSGWPPQPQSAWPPQPQSAWPQPQSAWPPAQGWPPAQPQYPQPQGWPPAQPQYPQPEGWAPAPPAPPSWQPAAPSRPSRLPAVLSVVAAALIAFSAGMVVEHLAAPPPAQQPQQEAPLEGFAVYEQALQDIRENFVGRDSLTDEQLLYGSIRGMVDSLGDYNHTTFLTPAEYADFQNQLSGSVAGIGVLIVEDNGAFVIERVVRDSPADKAGLVSGDRITAVDGTSVTGLDFDGLAALVRGDVGTSVTVTVVHAGSTTPVEYELTRAEVAMPLVDWGMIPGTTIADIALYEFSDGASSQLAKAITAAEAKGATAIVLDLRGNPGGYAAQATAVLGQFLSGGVAYIEEDANGNRDEVMVEAGSSQTTLPMVVLVDGYTASAAEVVAGCLQDSGRAMIVGMNTVGTGTILMPFQLSDGSVLLLGVSDWLTPKGNRIFGAGIAPDTMVAMPTGALPFDPYDLPVTSAVQLEASGDAQLLKAVELLGH